jgi:hypothetical protein
MEFMLQYAWLHRMFPLSEMRTTAGSLIEVVSPGIQNTDAGPDFIGACIKIDGMEWNGNVEVHLRSSDWYFHKHDHDPAYNSVILHVVMVVDCEAMSEDGRAIPQLQMDIPQSVSENYTKLIASDANPKCREVLTDLPRVVITSWFSSLYVERLEQRTRNIMDRRKQLDNNWESTMFVTLCRNFGFGKNGDAFEQLARLIPMNALAKHRDDLFQIEAMFFGVAGLLGSSGPSLPEYYHRLSREFDYLRHKFQLQTMEPHQWKFLRLRPQNFPHIRIAQLATMYHSGLLNMSKVVNSDSVADLYQLLHTQVSDFWTTHYSFKSEATKRIDKVLTKSSKDLIIINTIIPLLFAYGRYKSDESLCEKALRLLSELKPEKNHFVDEWRSAGIECRSASESQAIIQLVTRYCQPKDCIHCRFGHEYIKHNPSYLNEEL